MHFMASLSSFSAETQHQCEKEKVCHSIFDLMVCIFLNFFKACIITVLDRLRRCHELATKKRMHVKAKATRWLKGEDACCIREPSASKYKCMDA
jgi:hypothetical protein